MKTFIVGVVTFTIGSVSGFFVGKYISKKKYLDLADREVASVKEAFNKHYDLKNPTQPAKSKNSPVKKEETTTSLINKDTIDYEAIKKDRVQYVEYASRYSPKKNEGEKDEDKPVMIYILTPEEFQTSDYNCQSLTWYADGVLADDEYNIIKDIKGHIGDEALNTFGQYEDDCVYVRNDVYKIDYEILLDERDYSDVAPARIVATSPEDE